MKSNTHRLDYKWTENASPGTVRPHMHFKTFWYNMQCQVHFKAIYSAFICSLTSEGNVSKRASSTTSPLRFKGRQTPSSGGRASK